MPYSSFVTAVQGVYAGLSAAAFPGGAKPKGPFLDEAPVTGTTGLRMDPPYVVIADDGAEPQWSFGSDVLALPGQNAVYRGGFRLTAYATSQGVADAVVAAVLWNGQAPNARAGLAFCTLDLTLPEKGKAGGVVPGRVRRMYAGLDKDGARVHATEQAFAVWWSVGGDGL